MNKMLTELNEFMKTQPFDIIRISEIHNGVADTLEYKPENPCQNCYSVAKSFTMTAIGLLFDKGLVRPEDKVCDIMKEEFPEGADERWKKVTVDMCLTHRPGLPGGFLDIDCNRSTDFTDDYLRYMFLYPLQYDPGTEERYSDGAFYLLSCIVEKISGMGLDDFLWKELGIGMQFQEMAWSHCPKGHSMGATGLYMHSSDVVKLGALYLNKGVYGGKRYLSEEWCRLVTERQYTFEPDESGTVWFKGGMCGQKLYFIPSQNRAVALQSFGGNSGVITEFLRDYKD